MPSTSSCSAASLDSRSGAKPPSSPTAVVMPRGVSVFLRCVEDLGAHPQAVGEGAAPGGDDHELLEVDGVVRVRAAVDDVHHRDGQDVRRLAAEVAPERLVLLGAAAARAAASETPRIALAPRRDLFGVPSRSMSALVEPGLVEHVEAARRPGRSRR